MTPFRVVVLGTSFGGSVHAAAFARHPGFELAGVAGRTEERARRVAEAHGAARAGADWRALLDEVRPDVVSIVTPVDLHHPMTLAAIERGAHVLCEKPTALSRWQAAEMRDAAAAAGRVAAMNHEFRFFPARRHALEQVRRGDIGAPFRGEILGRYPIWARPESRGMTWLSDRARGGGVLGALGSHHTDCLRQFFGEPEEVTASVRVDQPRRVGAPGAVAGTATADDACTVLYRFAGDATAIIDLEACAPYRWERFEIHGREATLRWDETGYRLWRIAAGKEPEELVIPEPLRLEPRPGDPALVAPFLALLDRFHRALRGEEPMAPSLEDGVAVQSALDAARASSDARATVRIERPAPGRAGTIVPAAGVAPAAR